MEPLEAYDMQVARRRVHKDALAAQSIGLCEGEGEGRSERKGEEDDGNEHEPKGGFREAIEANDEVKGAQSARGLPTVMRIHRSASAASTTGFPATRWRRARESSSTLSTWELLRPSVLLGSSSSRDASPPSSRALATIVAPVSPGAWAGFCALVGAPLVGISRGERR